MSNSKKSKKLASSESDIGVLERPTEAAIVAKFAAAANELASASSESAPVAAPTEDAMASIWNRGQRITGLWGKNERGNSWVSIRGVGWKKLSDASDVANQALTALAVQAFQTGRNIDYREESDGMIHEIYVW